MLNRVLEPEVMDSVDEARDYDTMDHSHVNRAFAADFLAFYHGPGPVLDLGTGTAQIPIELCRQHPSVRVVAVDLAAHMLALGKLNVERAGLADRVRLEKVDAKGLSFDSSSFPAVMSNSIIHHIPEPAGVLAEITRVLQPGGAVFVRDLLRPDNDEVVRHLVQTYAGDANAHQRQMFDDSLRAALTLEEIRTLVSSWALTFSEVRQTTDRHWTWVGRK